MTRYIVDWWESELVIEDHGYALLDGQSRVESELSLQTIQERVARIVNEVDGEEVGEVWTESLRRLPDHQITILEEGTR